MELRQIAPGALLIAAGLLLTAAPAAWGNAPADRPATAPDYRLQEGDDRVAAFEPVESRSEAAARRLDAAAWFMSGRILESRNQFREALEAYRKSVSLDPESAEVYESLIPLAFSLDHVEEAVRYSLKAVELNPHNYELLQRLGLHMAAQQQFERSVELLEKAAASNRLDRESEAWVRLMRDMAVVYTLAGDREKAADCYEIVLDALITPRKYQLDFRMRARLLADGPTTFERIGQTMLDAGRVEVAVRAFEQAAKTRQGQPGVLGYNLAQVYLQTGEPEKALTELQKYLDAQLQSKGRDAYELLGQILEKLDREDELLARVKGLADKDPHNNTLQLYLADKYLEAGELDAAEDLFKKTIAKGAGGEGHAGLVAVYRKQNKTAELLEALGNAFSSGAPPRLETDLKEIADDPALFARLLEAGRERAAAEPSKLRFGEAYILGQMCVQKSETAAAVEFYRHALAQPQDGSALLYDEIAQYLLRNREYALAAGFLTDAVDRANPADLRPQFLFLLSQAHELNGQTEKALEAIAQAQKMLPENPLLHFQEAWIYSHSRQWDKAEELFNEVIRKFPQNESIVRRVRFSLSNLYVQKGDMPRAEAVLEEVLEKHPDDPSVNNDLGYLWADQGKHLERAEKMIRKAIEAEPDNVAYLDSMGWVLYKRGKFEEALEWLLKAAGDADAVDATIWDHLGDCYHRLGKTEKARETWQKALDVARKEARPDEKLIKSIQAKLDGDAEPAAVVETADEE